MSYPITDIEGIEGEKAAILNSVRIRTTERLLEAARTVKGDRKSTRLNSSHTVIYTLSLHDALPISHHRYRGNRRGKGRDPQFGADTYHRAPARGRAHGERRSEEHTSELQSHSDLHSFPTRRSSDLPSPISRESKGKRPRSSIRCGYVPPSACSRPRAR